MLSDSPPTESPTPSFTLTARDVDEKLPTVDSNRPVGEGDRLAGEPLFIPLLVPNGLIVAVSEPATTTLQCVMSSPCSTTTHSHIKVAQTPALGPLDARTFLFTNEPSGRERPDALQARRGHTVSGSWLNMATVELRANVLSTAALTSSERCSGGSRNKLLKLPQHTHTRQQ